MSRKSSKSDIIFERSDRNPNPCVVSLGYYIVSIDKIH